MNQINIKFRGPADQNLSTRSIPMKRYLKYCAFLFVFTATGGMAQNICTNGDFDTYTTPPNNYSQICYANGWLSPSGICTLVAGTGSPDYYNTMGSGGAKPPATWWSTLMPHSGVGMAGFATWYNSPNYREYVARQLSAPMVIGQTYQVTFWISNGVSWLHLVGTNNIGVNFSTNPLVQTLGNPILLTPQLETSTVIYDTGWKQVTFTYTATAAYQYITFGNFHNDAATTHASFGTGTYANYGAYYYIDDVVIQPAAPLPVTLLSFTGVFQNNVNHLEWVTAAELNNAYFQVEKSNNGIDFSPAGIVDGNGNSTVALHYEFDDRSTLYAISYYRLKQVDYNGQYRYSTVIVVHSQTGNTFHVVVSVKDGVATLNWETAVGGTLSLIDLAGRLLATYEVYPEQREMQMNLTGCRPGIYVIAFNASGKDCRLKIFIN